MQETKAKENRGEQNKPHAKETFANANMMIIILLLIMITFMLMLPSMQIMDVTSLVLALVQWGLISYYSELYKQVKPPEWTRWHYTQEQAKIERKLKAAKAKKSTPSKRIIAEKTNLSSNTRALAEK